MEMLFFEEQLLVELPDSFQRMDKNKIAMMYPYDEKPQIILEEEDKQRFCTFSILENQRLTDSQIEGAIYSICKVVTSLYPSCLADEPQLMKCGEGTCGWFSIMTAGTEEKLFHVMYIFSVNENMMLGTMGCIVEDEAGKKQMVEIMKSLKSLRRDYSYARLGQNILRQENKKM